MAGGGSSINSVTFTPIKTTFETSSGYENGGTITINCSGAPDSAVDITNATSSDSSIAEIFVNSLSRTVSGNNVTLEYRVWAKSPGTATLTAEAWDNVNLRSVAGTLQVTVVSPTPAEDTTYLNERGLRHLWQGIDAAKLDTNGNAYRTKSIPYGECDSTSTATVFTATVPGITELRDGVCMWLKNGVVTSAAGFTININGLGAKPVYSNMAAASAESTMFNVNYTFLFVYDSTRVSGGCWMLYRGYNSNDNTIGYQIRTNSQSLPASDAFVRYRLLFTSADGTKYVPATTSTSTNATASRTVNQTKINPFGRIFYYSSTTAIAQGSRPGAGVLWEQYAIVLGYSFNRTGAALTLTSWKPVYIKCAPQTDGSAIIDSTTPYVQDLPTTEDGKIYIFLGIAYDATHVELQLDHPVYCYKGGIIRPWTNPAIDSALDANSTNPVQNSVITAAIGNVETILQTLNNGGGAQ